MKIDTKHILTYFFIY